MARPSGPKTRCSGTWTESKFNNFIRNQLRGATRKWKPIQDAKKEAQVERGIYRCASCGENVPLTIKQGRKRITNVFVDHIKPIVDPEVGFTTFDDFIDRMFCNKENLQVLCGDCHDKKTSEERKLATQRRGYYATHPKEYTVYVSMKGRCNNPNKSDYKYYGKRGISVCPEWEKSFEKFLEDMGPRPEGTTLDRIDHNGNYEKNNCRWADWETQCNNKTTSVYLTINGITKTLTEWSQERSINRSTISYRIKNDYTIEEALEFDPLPTKAELIERRKKEKE